MVYFINTLIVPFAIKGSFETWGKTRTLPKLFNEIVIQFGQPITDFNKDESVSNNPIRLNSCYWSISLFTFE